MTNKEKILFKIDWKFFNFLKDKFLEFEDNGHIIEIYIISRISTDKDIFLYKHIDEHNTIYNMSNAAAQRAYGGTILYMLVFITKDNFLHCDETEELGNEFFERIKNKCTKVERKINYVTSKGSYIVKPN